MKYKDIKDYELMSAYPIPGIFYELKTKKYEIDEYVILYNKYRKMFTQFIINKINLKMWDEQIAQQIHIKPLDKAQMDIYQYCSSDELKYIYIRNNIYIEKLTKGEIEYLKNVDHTKEELTQEEQKFIKKTFPKVIAEIEGEGEFRVNFGNENAGFFATENVVVIGIRYNLDVPNDLEQVFNANGFCKLIIDKIRIKEESNLGFPIIGNIYSSFGVNIMQKHNSSKKSI